jgi:hypothetical protein
MFQNMNDEWIDQRLSHCTYQQPCQHGSTNLLYQHQLSPTSVFPSHLCRRAEMIQRLLFSCGFDVSDFQKLCNILDGPRNVQSCHCTTDATTATNNNNNNATSHAAENVAGGQRLLSSLSLSSLSLSSSSSSLQFCT